MLASRALGLGLLIVGGLAVGFGWSINAPGLGQNQDPGPRAFPLALGALLIVGGLFELIRLAFEKRAGSSERSESKEANGDVTGQFGGLRHSGILFVGLCLYVGLMGFLGFTWSTLVFSFVMMSRLGVRWPLALCVTMGLIGLMHLLFGALFKVQLPSSSLGLPF